MPNVFDEHPAEDEDVLNSIEIAQNGTILGMAQVDSNGDVVELNLNRDGAEMFQSLISTSSGGIEIGQDKRTCGCSPYQGCRKCGRYQS